MRKVLFAVALVSLLAPRAYSACRDDIEALRGAFDDSELFGELQDKVEGELELAASAAENGNLPACIAALRRAGQLARG